MPDDLGLSPLPASVAAGYECPQCGAHEFRYNGKIGLFGGFVDPSLTFIRCCACLSIATADQLIRVRPADRREEAGRRSKKSAWVWVLFIGLLVGTYKACTW